VSRAPSDLVNSRKSDDGMTPLHLACQNGFRDIAELLIEQVEHQPAHCSRRRMRLTAYSFYCIRISLETRRLTTLGAAHTSDTPQ